MELDAVGLGLPVFAGGGGGGAPAVLVGLVAFFLAPARAWLGLGLKLAT